MLYHGFRSGGSLLLWAAVIVVTGLAGYATSRLYRPAASRQSR
jgi:hypothetical protein